MFQAILEQKIYQSLIFVRKSMILEFFFNIYDNNPPHK